MHITGTSLVTCIIIFLWLSWFSGAGTFVLILILLLLVLLRWAGPYTLGFQWALTSHATPWGHHLHFLPPVWYWPMAVQWQEGAEGLTSLWRILNWCWGGDVHLWPWCPLLLRTTCLRLLWTGCRGCSRVIFALWQLLFLFVFLFTIPGVVVWLIPFLHNFIIFITGIFPFIFLFLPTSVILLCLKKKNKGKNVCIKKKPLTITMPLGFVPQIVKYLTLS